MSVAWGMPPDAGSELVMVADAVGTQESRALNPQTRPRTERFSLDVVCIVRQGSPSGAESASRRAAVLATEVGSQLREDPSVAGTLQFAVVAGVALHEDYDDTNTWREARWVITVACTARI